MSNKGVGEVPAQHGRGIAVGDIGKVGNQRLILHIRVDSSRVE
jgi:hypothetical protein